MLILQIDPICKNDLLYIDIRIQIYPDGIRLDLQGGPYFIYFYFVLTADDPAVEVNFNISQTYEIDR